MSCTNLTNQPWSNEEVRTFLSLLADERIQRDGMVCDQKVFQELAATMLNHGYHRTPKQCREKLKKLKFEYRAVKDYKQLQWV